MLDDERSRFSAEDVDLGPIPLVVTMDGDPVPPPPPPPTPTPGTPGSPTPPPKPPPEPPEPI